MELAEVLQKRRSVRRFQDTEVPQELIDRIIQMARSAPSAGGLRAYRTAIVKDQAIMRQLYSRVVAPLELVVCALPEKSGQRYGGRGRELYDVCEKAGVDYYTVRDAVYGDDPRFNLWHTFVYPRKRGMQSKCIPKDVLAWCAWAESLGYAPEVTRAILKRNERWIAK